MCGIIGICSSKTVNEHELRNAILFIEHRGPDGDGLAIMPNGRVGLGHRRLSIIDLSDSGAQPMSNEEGTVWVTFNGEIYNYRHLRSELIKRQHQFKGHSDTEVLVHGYEEWGTALVDRLEGMFAFGIWDEKNQQLVLGRDRLGIKPLYYYCGENCFIFGSELKSFYPLSGFEREIDLSSVLDYLHYYVIPAPKTIWKNTFKLLPAHYLVYTPGSNKCVLEEYWSLAPDSKRMSSMEAVEQARSMFERSVKYHLESDVPIGVFLSSGYDSSALASYVRKLNGNVDTFSIGFKGSAKSEHRDAATIAKHFGTTHHELVLDEDYMDVLPRLSSYYDEPFGVTSMVSYYYVSQLASEHNKVVFAGDGGDEVFGGYGWYHAIMKQFGQRSLLQKLSHLSVENRKAFYQNSYFTFMGTDIPWVKGIISDDLAKYYPDDIYWPYTLPDEHWHLDPIKVFQMLDFKRYLPDVALPRADRSSMATSLEVRVPFLDHNLVEFLMGLDKSVYYKPPVKKFLLHEIIKDKLPEAILKLPKKGFGNPLDPFYAGRQKIISRIQAGSLLNTRWFNEKLDLQQLDKKQLWLLYNLELWITKWL